MIAIIADQHHSRSQADRVPEALDVLARLGAGLRLPFERTAGDEVQALTADPAVAVAAAQHLSRLGGWRLGLGLGAVESPLPGSTRAARGSAYVAAREAVERARQSPAGLAVTASPEADATGAHDAETVLWLLRDLWQRRTGQGWELADALVDVSTQAEAAARLGITPSAVSQRARSARLEESARGAALATSLLAHALDRAEEDR